MLGVFFKSARALWSGDEVWRSQPIDTATAGRFEIIVKDNEGVRMVVSKNKTGAGSYEYQVFEPAGARALGEALIAGAMRAGHSTSTASGT